MSKPFFSITIPAYKQRFLYEAIESCLAQTYKNFELIVVDDASPEDLASIVKAFDDSRIRYYRNEKNCGAIDVVDNWNICLSHAQGEYIICMGDDDCLLPCCLEEYARMIKERPEIGLLHGWTEVIDEQSQVTMVTVPRPQWESAYSIAWNRWKHRHQQYIGDWCFSTKWLRAQGGYFKLPLAWGSDDITAIIGALKNGVLNSQCLCFQYRINSFTISKNGDIRAKMEAIKQERVWYDTFLVKEPIDELDFKYRKMMITHIKKIFNRKYGNTIYLDLRKNIFRIFSWYGCRKKYGYTNYALCYAIYLWLKDFIKCLDALHIISSFQINLIKKSDNILFE